VLKGVVLCFIRLSSVAHCCTVYCRVLQGLVESCKRHLTFTQGVAECCREVQGVPELQSIAKDT